MTVFYSLPAQLLQPGVSTDDGQDVLEVRVDDSLVIAVVYTPRADDPDADSYNRSTPETRLYDRNCLVGLAVFDTTEVDLSTDPEAKKVVNR